MAKSEDPDQTAPSGTVWPGPAPFAYIILSETMEFEILRHLPEELRCPNNSGKYGNIFYLTN